MDNFLIEILARRWKEKKLGHFYIITSDSGLSEMQLWIKNFFFHLFPTLVNIEEHPDFLFLNPPKKGEYHLESLNLLTHFLSYHAQNIGHKFVIFSEANRIGETLSNKLLKTLESPGKNITIFFLNMQNRKLLPTIESRAITLRLKSKDKIPENNFFNELLPLSKLQELYPQFLKFLKEREILDNELLESLGIFIREGNDINEVIKKFNQIEGQDQLISLLLDWERQHHSNFALKEQILEEIKYYEEAKNMRSAVGQYPYGPLVFFNPQKI